MTISAEGVILLTGTLDSGSEGALSFGLNFDGECFVAGCTDTNADNYNSAANNDDGSCLIYEACPYDIYVEYSPYAESYNANSCQTLIVYGCTNWQGENYNSQANTDDGSCIIIGCLDEMADNYNSSANQESGNCNYYGCINPTAENYDPQANYQGLSCVIYGCVLSAFPNYNSEATNDDGSCDMNSTDVFGCSNTMAYNFDPEVNQDNGSCQYSINCADLTIASIEVTNGQYPSEISWTVGEYSGDVGLTYVCLENDCNLFEMYDS